MLIDHIGVVVCSLEDGIEQWQDLFGYRVASDVVVNIHQKVSVVFLAKAGSVAVKLVQPLGPDSPIASFARRGGGIHHICFRCNDLKLEIPLLKSKGARFILPPQPGEAFNNKDIAFFLAKNNLNIELIDTTEKRGWHEASSDSRIQTK
jgi:methylmalonyl-CoA/ethylmalonyl-CoA epimerase